MLLDIKLFYKIEPNIKSIKDMGSSKLKKNSLKVKSIQTFI